MSESIPIENQQQPGYLQANEESQQYDSDAIIPDSNGEPEQIKARMEEMEKEAAKLRDLHSQLSGTDSEAEKEKRDIDSRSIYIGNVDYDATPLELQQHFSSAGVVNRVTILMNKFTGQPKGFAYLEFADIDGVNKAVATLDGSVFRERELKVNAKRTNVPGISSTNRGRGGRGGRGSFRGRGGRGGRGRGRGSFRGGPGTRFSPY